MTPTVSVIITDLIAVFCSCTNQTIPLIRDCINPCKSKFPLKKKTIIPRLQQNASDKEK